MKPLDLKDLRAKAETDFREFKTTTVHPQVVLALIDRIETVLKYCRPHTDQMWAATIVGTLLGCDLRDASSAIAELEKAEG